MDKKKGIRIYRYLFDKTLIKSINGLFYTSLAQNMQQSPG